MTDAQTRAANRKEGLEPMSIEQARTTDRWSRIDADKINDVVIPDGIQLWWSTAGQEYNSLIVDIPAPPRKVKRWAVRGNLNGLDIDQHYTDEYAAQMAVNKWEVILSSSIVFPLTIEQIEVEVE